MPVLEIALFQFKTDRRFLIGDCWFCGVRENDTWKLFDIQLFILKIGLSQLKIVFIKVNFGDFGKLMRGGETRAVAQVNQIIIYF